MSKQNALNALGLGEERISLAYAAEGEHGPAKLANIPKAVMQKAVSVSEPARSHGLNGPSI